MANKKLFPLSNRNLDKYDVLVVDDYKKPQYFDVRINFNSLSYGKYFISIGILDNDNAQYTLKLSSHVQIEIKDINDNIILHDLIDSPTISDLSSFYIRVDEDVFNTYESLDNGLNNINITILGELTDNISNIPDKWVDIYNVKMTIPLSLRKDLQNISDLYFNGLPSFNVDENIFFDSGSSLYNRSFANVTVDNLHSVGGMAKFGEISYLSGKSSTDDDEILNTFEIIQSGSGIETIRQHISNVGITGLDDVYDSGPGSGSNWIGDFKYDDQIDNWNKHSYLSTHVTQSFITNYATLNSDGTHISKIFRYSHDEEDYKISYRISGSGTIQIKESKFQTDLTQSLSDISNDSTVTTIYSQSFTNFDPTNNKTWTSSYSSNDLSRNDVISSSEGNAMVSGSFIMTSGSYASIYVSSTDTCSISVPSIKPKIFKGQNPPFYFHKVQLPAMARRDQDYNFSLKLMNPNMDSAKNTVDDNNVLITSSNYFTGSSITFEKSDTLFVPTGTGDLKQAFIIGESRNFDDDNMMGVFYDTGKSSVIFGKDNQATDAIEFNQSGSNSHIVISGSKYDSTFDLVSTPTGGGGLRFVKQMSTLHQYVDTGYNALNIFNVGVAGSGSNLPAGFYINRGLPNSLGDNRGLMVSMSTGYVGFGINDPVERVHVAGNIRADGDIIANQYIISSSVTYMTSSFSSGSTQFGDTSDDTHIFSGSVTSTEGFIVDKVGGSGDKLIHVKNDGSTKFYVDEDGITHTDYIRPGTFTDADTYIRFLETAGGDAIVFYAGDGIEQKFRIDSGKVVVNNWILTNEDVDFIVQGKTDTNLIYSDAFQNKVGIGVQPDANSKKFTVAGDISGSDVVYAVSASFGADKTNQWMDGSEGNDEYIALTPGDFHVVDSTRASANAITFDGGGSIRCENNGANYHAIKIIPKGFEAHRGVVYGNSVGDAWTANSGSILNQGTVSIRGNTAIGTEADFTSVVTGNGTSYVVMEWNPTATSDELDGGKIFIRRLT